MEEKSRKRGRLEGKSKRERVGWKKRVEKGEDWRQKVSRKEGEEQEKKARKRG